MSATADRLFRDLVVVLPGITGSVLEQNGREVWGFSAEVAWNVLRSRGESIRHLALDGDDPEAPDLGDGVRATKIIHRAHSLPALHKNIGYGPLVSALTKQLGLRAGDGDGSNAGNLFEFAYDWRRDNRASARALKRLIDDRLPAWREASGATDAKVVLVAHSMGPAPQLAQAPALALDLDDAYAADEPVVVGVETVNYVEPITTITADLAPASAPAETRRIAFGWDGQRYTAVLDDLAPGTYAIRVESGAVFPAPAPPVHDLFEVVPRSEL